MRDIYIINYEPKKYRFGTWAGDREGIEEDINCCFEEVYDRFTHRFYQCGRKRGHGYKNLFCSQHAKMYNQEELLKKEN